MDSQTFAKEKIALLIDADNAPAAKIDFIIPPDFHPAAHGKTAKLAKKI